MNLGIVNISSPMLEKAIAKGMNQIAQTDKVNRFIEWGAKESTKKDLLGKTINNNNAKVVPVMAALLPIWISSFYVYSNIKSDKIPKERKTPLLINDVIICLFSTIAGVTVSKLFDAMQTTMNNNLKTVIKDIEKQAQLKQGIKQMMAIAAFTVVFRYLGPVIATPLADKVNTFLIKKGYIEDPEKGKKAEKAKANQAPKIEIKEVPASQDTQAASLAFNNFLNQYKNKPEVSFRA